MLVLTRRPGESIKIGSDISVTVTAVQGNRVRIGIEAPRKLRILRGELTDWLVRNEGDTERLQPGGAAAFDGVEFELNLAAGS